MERGKKRPLGQDHAAVAASSFFFLNVVILLLALCTSCVCARILRISREKIDALYGKTERKESWI
jgi:hypothetical protein